MKRKTIFGVFILLLLSFSLFAQNFNDALLKAVQFYDANRCGPLAGEDNIFSDWRGACHTKDGQDVGVDLTGGFHDAGDHVKFGLPQAYTAGVLGWALYEFKDQIAAAGATEKLLKTLKYFTDYFIKSKVGSRFYYQVGEGEADHTYWGPPEEQSSDRPTYAWADSSKAATDVLSQTSAALSLMYLNYREINSSYANQCLTLARDLFDMAKSNIGRGNGQSFYQSSSMYDDLSWAATWLYVIDNDASLISDVKTWLQKPTQNGDVPLNQNHWTMCWDDMGLAVIAKLGMLTGDSQYISVLEENLRYWLNDLATTPGGMKYLNNWGVLRYNAAESMIALLYYGHTGTKAYLDFAEKQLKYMLGANPANMSYLIGYGSNWAKHPHHRAANGYTYANGDNQKPAKHTITGALVGGPDQSDRYVDDVNQFQYTEVALDYNAGLVGALAGYLKYAGGVIETPTPVQVTPTPVENTPTPTPASEYTVGDVNNDGNRNIVDALLIAQLYVGLPVPTYVVPEEYGDLNMDGVVNIVDALLIAQCYVGLPTAYC
ncbi:MAG: glycoside hydrolase family 9 protein [Spirochaetales bacterium]|nr:glycoside hydrolase family 9 protein [Spirochaetales bacterium]